MMVGAVLSALMAVCVGWHGMAAPSRARRARTRLDALGSAADVPPSRFAGSVSRHALARRLTALRRRDADADLIAFLDALARASRSGASPGQAFDEARAGVPEPLGLDLDRVLARAAAGDALGRALGAWPVPPRSGASLTRAVLRIGLEAGGDLARAVEEVAATLRHRVAGRQETKALAAQARLSATVVALAPLAFTLLAGATDPAILRFLLATPAGWACLCGGLGLDAAGALWMRRITASVMA